MTRRQMKDWLDAHTCTLTATSSCRCIYIRQELAILNKKLGLVPYKYHSPLLKKTTDRDLAEAKWNEVREDRI